jgi:integrase
LCALQDHRARGSTLAVAAERLLAIGIREPELVIDNGIGEPWHPSTFSKAWKSWAESHEFPGIGLHGLRHGAATLLLAGGTPDAVAATIMGHADTKILRRYQDVVANFNETPRRGWMNCSEAR